MNSARLRRPIAALPLVVEREAFTLVHGSPREPVWEYVLSPDTARENLASFATPWCLIGHSHRPLVFTCEDDGCTMQPLLPDDPLTLGGGRRLLNPGAAGQPRDGDPRASYAIHDGDTRTLTLHRVPYDIAETQGRMRRQGLLPPLVARLSYGL